MNDQALEVRIRLLLFDEYGLSRASLGRWLASEPDFEVAGECGTSAEALEVLSKSTVNVVLLDFDVGTEHWNDFISAARQAGYQGRFLIVTGSPDVRNSAIALQLGASGIFLKSEAPDRLVQAIRLVGSGGIWVDQTIIHLLADRLVNQQAGPEDPKFNGLWEDRERNVLQGIMEGLSNRKIGDNMGLSESSVKNIVQRLFGKTRVKTRSQLVRVALEGSLNAGHEVLKRQLDEMPNAAPLRSHKRRRPTEANPPAGEQSDE